MKKFIPGLILVFLTLCQQCLAGPVAVEKSSSDDGDMKTSETFGYGYYQPNLYAAAPQLQLAPAAPLAAVGTYHAAPYSTFGSSYPIAAPLATTTSVLSSSSLGNARSAYGYNNGYKYGGYGSRWGYGSGASSNEVYRRHQPIYVAWG